MIIPAWCELPRRNAGANWGERCSVGVALGICLLTYAWQHFECIQLRYSLEQLQAAKTQTTELNQQLRLEVASLASPMRIDAIARQQLGLSVPVPGQVAPAQGSRRGRGRASSVRRPRRRGRRSISMTRPAARPETPKIGGLRHKLASPEPREKMEPRNPRVRWLVVFVLAVVWMGAVFARLGYLQLFRYSEYLSKAQRQQLRVRETTPKRGSIFDRNGHELAVSLPVDYCFADSSEINDPDMVANLLSRVLNIAPEEIGAKLAEPHPFPGAGAQAHSGNCRAHRSAEFARHLRAERTGARLSAALARFAGHRLRERGSAGTGRHRIRARQSDSRQAGRTLVTKDARRRGVDRSEVAAQPGSSVTLTSTKISSTSPRRNSLRLSTIRTLISGSIVIEDPNSGELLAIANWPTFDSNDPSDFAGRRAHESRRGRGVRAGVDVQGHHAGERVREWRGAVRRIWSIARTARSLLPDVSFTTGIPSAL